MSRMGKIEVQNLEQVQTVLNRISRRVARTVVGVFSPSILHTSKEPVDEDGIVGTVLFPCDGVVTVVALRTVGATAKTPVNITLTHTQENITSSISVNATREISSATYKLVVKALSTLTVYAPAGSSIVASMMFTPKVGEYKLENYLLDNVERVADEGIRDTINEVTAAGTA